MIDFNKDIEIRIIDKAICRFKEFEKKYEWIDYLIAPISVSIIVLVILYIKGVYPFGVNTIAYYDLPHNFVPMYTFFWDVMHGDAGLYLNWYSGLGVSMADIDGAFLLFPTNLFMLFSSRDNIIYFMSFFLIIKMALAAFGMSYYCKKHYYPSALIVSLGILYSCSGFVLQDYTNPFFLDLVIIFPFLVWAFERMIIEHKYIWFTILIFLAFLSYSQLIISIYIYLIIKGYILLKSVSEKEKSKSIELFFFTTIITILLSCFNLIPMFIQLLQSTRVQVNSDFDYRYIMKNVFCPLRKHKQFMMYGSEIAVSVLIIAFLKGKVVLRKYYKNIFMIIVLTLPILHEGIDLLWHGGSYKHFPLRFGYMITFECLQFVGEFIKNEEIASRKIIEKSTTILSVAIIPFMTYVLYDFVKDFVHSGIMNLTIYSGYDLIFVTLVLVYLCIFFSNLQTARYNLLLIVVFIQSALGCFGFVAPEIGESTNAKVATVFNSVNFRHELEGKMMHTQRIKLDPLEYSYNDGIIIQQPNISVWLNGLNKDMEIELHDRMGYCGAESTITDFGGTLFSDALLGVSAYGCSNNPDPYLYTTESGMNVHESKYVMPFGIVIDNEGGDFNSDYLDYQNDLFDYISGINDKDLIEILTSENYELLKRDITGREFFNIEKCFFNVKEDDGSDDIEIEEYSIRIPVKDTKTLYLSCDHNFVGELKILVNNTAVKFEAISVADEMKYIYPNEYYNGILSLGTYSNENIDLKIYTKNDSIDNVNIGLLNLDILNEGINKVCEKQKLDVSLKKNGMIVTGSINKPGRVFFPIGFSDNWHVKVNGKLADVKPCFNNAFVSVDVDEGDIIMEFTYIPKGLIVGVMLSVFGVIVAIILICVEKKGSLKGKPRVIIDKIFQYGYYTVFIVLFLILYVIPIYLKMSL